MTNPLRKPSKKSSAPPAPKRASPLPRAPAPHVTVHIDGGDPESKSDAMLAEVILRATPDLLVRLADARARGLASPDLAVLVLQDFRGGLRVAVEPRDVVGAFVAANTPHPEQIRASLARTLPKSLHCVVVIERGEDLADLGYVAIVIDDGRRASN